MTYIPELIIQITGALLAVCGLAVLFLMLISEEEKDIVRLLRYMTIFLCILAILVGVLLLNVGRIRVDNTVTGESFKTEEHLGHFIDEQGKIHDEYLHPYADGSMGFTGFTDDSYPTSVVAPAGTWFLEVDEDRMEDPSVVITTTEMVKKHSGEHVATAISFTFHIGEGGNIIAEEDPVLPTKAGN